MRILDAYWAVKCRLEVIKIIVLLEDWTNENKVFIIYDEKANHVTQ